MSLQPPKNGILFFNDRKFAVGLQWFTVDDFAGQGKKLAKKRAEKAGADFYCLRGGISPQHGFGFLSVGHRSGMPAAAAHIADMLVGEWHGVFRADNGWWHVIVHSDAVAPNGDTLYTSEEEAYNAFVETNDSHNWPHAYAPSEWEISGVGSNLRLSKLLDDPVETKLKPANLSATFGGDKKRNLVLMILGGIFLVAAAIIGYLTLTDASPAPQQVRIKSIEEIQRQQNAQSTQPEATPPKQVIPKDPFDYTIARPEAMIKACGQLFSKLVQPMPGWGIKQVTCNDRQAEVQWQKSRSGTIDLLAAEAERKFGSDVTTRINDRQFTTTMKMPSDLPTTDRRWMNLSQGRSSLLKSFEPRGDLKTDFNRPSPPPDLPPNKHAPKPFIDFTFETKRQPEEIVQYFNLPGLDLDQMSWNIEDGSWTYQGALKLDK